MFNKERKYWLLYFTPKHRSLSGVENRIFEVEYFINIFSTVLVHFLAPFFYLTFCPIQIQSVREKILLGNLSPSVIKYI